MDYRLLWGTFNKYTYIDLYFSTKSASQHCSHSTQSSKAKDTNSIVGTEATSCNAFHQSSAHRVCQFSKQRHRSSLPFLNHTLLQISQRRRIASKHASEDVTPQILNRIEVRRMRRPNLTVDLCDSTAAGMSSGSITAEWATVVVQHLPATPREEATALRQDVCVDDLDHLLPIQTLIKVKQ